MGNGEGIYGFSFSNKRHDTVHQSAKVSRHEYFDAVIHMRKGLITISSLAMKKLKMIVSERNMNAVRLSLKTGGCNGFEYNLEPTSVSSAPSGAGDGDEHFLQDGMDVYICGKSLLYLVGTHVDWKKSVMGEMFVFENPNAKSKCGCGTSFNA